MYPKEALTYKIEDKILAEVLGRQNFSSKESAILELVKNAYDAGAPSLKIEFNNTNDGVILTVTDNGEGMNDDEVRTAWMHVGKSNRGYINRINQRVYAGSKGIGRFALSRLGDEVEMYTKKKDEPGVLWSSNWNESYISKTNSVEENGTKFVIKNLRDRWTKKSIKPLKEYLSKIYNDSKMQIKIVFDTEEEAVSRLWQKAIIGENFVTSLKLTYDAETYKLRCVINSDEFKASVTELINFDSISSYNEIIEIGDVLRTFVEQHLEMENAKDDTKIDNYDISEEINEVLHSVGSFKGEFYFSLGSVSEKDYDYYEYKHKVLLDRFNSGIILYRNAFGIDSFEGRNDWLGFSQRASASPAAASHKTGSWKVRRSQISGFVEIDKEENQFITDLSNRQGIIENIYYMVFIEIILKGVHTFERYRQGIIREIHTIKKAKELDRTKKTDDSENAKELIRKLRVNNKLFVSLSKEEVSKITKEFDRRELVSEFIEKEKKEMENKLRYESQLLNVLATSQLKISSLGHEIKNDRNNIEGTPKALEDALKDATDWEGLGDETIPHYKNIPKLITDLKNNTTKILALTDNILEEMEKENFNKKEYFLQELLEEILKKWEKQYSWVRFNLKVHSSKKIIVSYAQLMIIFDNLILNSIQQNENHNDFEITIEISSYGVQHKIIYRDNGIGLNKAYLANPMRILEVHETNRTKGHGLGMWMVNNTINKLNGQVEKIDGSKGFNFFAYIKI